MKHKIRILIFILSFARSVSFASAGERAASFSLVNPNAPLLESRWTSMGWHPDIPTTPGKVIELLKTEAKSFSYESDHGVCGGRISKLKLDRHRSYSTEDGNIVHQFVIRFRLTKAHNYCESEKTVICEAPFYVLSTDGIVMEPWECEEL